MHFWENGYGGFLGKGVGFGMRFISSFFCFFLSENNQNSTNKNKNKAHYRVRTRFHSKWMGGHYVGYMVSKMSLKSYTSCFPFVFST